MVRLLRLAAAPVALWLAAPSAIARSPFLVHFESGSAALDERMVAILDFAAAEARDNPAAPVVIHANADRVGSAEANRRLSLRRGEAVRAALVRHGVAAERIRIEAHGEEWPLEPTADGVANPFNRYAWVVVEVPGDGR